MLPLPNDLYYMAYGRPAVATVTFVGTPVAGNTLTINGVVYTFGTDWGSRFAGSFTPNYVPGSSVRDLSELINGTDDQGRGSLTLLPNATIFARAAGNKLLLFAREPGTAGNSYTLSTNNSAAFVVSGATFSGGTTGSAAVSDATAANQTTQITAEQAILAKLPSLGTAGTASANVITVQGIAAGVPLPISGSFTIPAFDYQAFTYIAATNNIATQVFKTGGSAGTTVATLTFTYVAAGAADNDKIASITRS